jgi:hypothetical protein
LTISFHREFLAALNGSLIENMIVPARVDIEIPGSVSIAVNSQIVYES